MEDIGEMLISFYCYGKTLLVAVQKIQTLINLSESELFTLPASLFPSALLEQGESFWRFGFLGRCV